MHRKCSSDVEFLVLLQTQLDWFVEGHSKLSKTQLAHLRKATELVKRDRRTIVRNVPKRRAHTILTDLWKELPAVFFLCALAVRPDGLRNLKSETYMDAVEGWWKKAPKPEGLFEAMSTHKAELPPPCEVEAEDPNLMAKMSLRDLLALIHQLLGDQDLGVSCPLYAVPEPSFQIKKDGMVVTMTFSIQMAHQIMQHAVTLSSTELGQA